MSTAVADLAALQILFTTDAEDLARSTAFVRRARKWTGPTFAQVTVFGWLPDPTALVLAEGETGLHFSEARTGTARPQDRRQAVVRVPPRSEAIGEAPRRGLCLRCWPAAGKDPFDAAVPDGGRRSRRIPVPARPAAAGVPARRRGWPRLESAVPPLGGTTPPGRAGRLSGSVPPGEGRLVGGVVRPIPGTSCAPRPVVLRRLPIASATPPARRRSASVLRQPCPRRRQSRTGVPVQGEPSVLAARSPSRRGPLQGPICGFRTFPSACALTRTPAPGHREPRPRSRRAGSAVPAQGKPPVLDARTPSGRGPPQGPSYVPRPSPSARSLSDSRT